MSFFNSITRSPPPVFEKEEAKESEAPARKMVIGKRKIERAAMAFLKSLNTSPRSESIPLVTKRKEIEVAPSNMPKLELGESVASEDIKRHKQVVDEIEKRQKQVIDDFESFKL